MNGRNGAIESENGVSYGADSGSGNASNGPPQHSLRSLFPADPLSLRTNAETLGMPSSLGLGLFSRIPLHLPRIGSGAGAMPPNGAYATASYLMTHQQLLLEEQLRRDLLTEQILRSAQLRNPLLSISDSIRQKSGVKDTPTHAALRSRSKHGSEWKAKGRMRQLQSVVLKKKSTVTARGPRLGYAVSKFPLPSATRRTPVRVSKLPEFQDVWKRLYEAVKDSGMDDSQKRAYVKERFFRKVGSWNPASGASSSPVAGDGKPPTPFGEKAQPVSPGMKGIIFKRKLSELSHDHVAGRV